MTKMQTGPIDRISLLQKLAIVSSIRLIVPPIVLSVLWALSTGHASAQSCSTDPCDINACSSPSCPGYDVCTCSTDPNGGGCTTCIAKGSACANSGQCCSGLECDDSKCIPPQPTGSGGSGGSGGDNGGGDGCQGDNPGGCSSCVNSEWDTSGCNLGCQGNPPCPGASCGADNQWDEDSCTPNCVLVWDSQECAWICDPTAPNYGY
jgi:hypothetical protein